MVDGVLQNQYVDPNTSALSPESPYRITPHQLAMEVLSRFENAPDLPAAIAQQRVKPHQEQEPDIEDQLDALQKLHDRMEKQSGRKYKPEESPDEGMGFDKSDKMSMIGTGLVSGKWGLKEGVARLKQLGLQYGELEGFQKPGASKKFTEEFNQREAKDRLLQEAMIAHPTIGAIGKFAGSIIPSLAVPGGALEKGGTIAGEAILNAIERAGLKIGARNLLTKGLGRATTGAAIGELQYDPTGSSGNEQAAGGALASLALLFGGRMVKAIARPTARAAQEILDRHGIALSPYPRMEKFLGSIPFSTLAENLSERKKRLMELAQKTAAGIQKKLQKIIMERYCMER